MPVGSRGGHALRRAWRHVAAAALIILAAGSAGAQEAERLIVKRTVDFTSADWNGDDSGRLEIIARVAREGGRLAGVAEVKLDWTWPHPPCENDAGFRGIVGYGPVGGEIVAGRLKMRLAVPVSGSYTSLIGSFLGIHVCLTRTVEFVYDGDVMEWGDFDLELDGNRHDSTVMSSSTEGGTIVLPGIVRTTVSPAAAEPGDGVIAAVDPPAVDDDFSVHFAWWQSRAEAAGHPEGIPAGTEVELPFLGQDASAP